MPLHYKPILKKVLKIALIAGVAFYFIGNVLPNLIGVPLAAYHSYDAWNDSQKSISEIKSEFESEGNRKFPASIGIVNDFSQIFTATERNELSKVLHEYNIETTRQVVVIAVDSISPYDDIQKYATDIGSEWGVGTSEKDNGLIIVLCNPCRRIGIATGYGTELVLTDEICKEVIETTMVPAFKNEQYYNGLLLGIHELIRKWI